jgi:hypothetical protein
MAPQDPRRYFDGSAPGQASSSGGGPQSDEAVWEALRRQVGAMREAGLGDVLPAAKAFQV